MKENNQKSEESKQEQRQTKKYDDSTTTTTTIPKTGINGIAITSIIIILAIGILSYIRFKKYKNIIKM